MLKIAAVLFLILLIAYILLVQNARKKLSGDELKQIEEVSQFSILSIAPVIVIGIIAYFLIQTFSEFEGWLTACSGLMLLLVLVLQHVRKERKLVMMGVPTNFIHSLRIANVIVWFGYIFLGVIIFLWNIRIL